MIPPSVIFTLGLFTVPLFIFGLTYLFVSSPWGRWKVARNFSMATCASLLSLWGIFVVLEIGFRWFFVQSDGFLHTLAAKRWHEKYWEPVNAFGFRDREISKEELSSKRKLFVVGDSFVAGIGIENQEDRFSNRLGKLLPPNWIVLNFGRNGWNTSQELEALRAFPTKPDLIVWSYYINDIEDAAGKVGARTYPNLWIRTPWLRFAVGNSYFLNFVYWRYFRAFSRIASGPRWKSMEADFQNQEVWQLHRLELQDLLDYTRQRHIALLVVLFPRLTDVDGSLYATAKVAKVFQEGEVPVINLSSYLTGLDPQDLIVNSVDAHPNVTVHQEVAQLIYKEIKTRRLLEISD